MTIELERWANAKRVKIRHFKGKGISPVAIVAWEHKCENNNSKRYRMKSYAWTRNWGWGIPTPSISDPVIVKCFVSNGFK